MGGVPKDDEDADNGDDNELEVGEDEKGSGEGGEADGVAGEVDVGKWGGVGHLPHLIIIITRWGWWWLWNENSNKLM